jgi:hypothetical protein
LANANGKQAMMSTCEHFQADLSASLDGELSDAERAAVEAHLRACPACQSELAELRTLKESLVGLPRALAPQTLLANIQQELTETAPDAASNIISFPVVMESEHKPWNWTTPLLSLAALLMMGVLVFLVLPAVARNQKPDMALEDAKHTAPKAAADPAAKMPEAAKAAPSPSIKDAQSDKDSKDLNLKRDRAADAPVLTDKDKANQVFRKQSHPYADAAAPAEAKQNASPLKDGVEQEAPPAEKAPEATFEEKSGDRKLFDLKEAAGLRSPNTRRERKTQAEPESEKNFQPARLDGEAGGRAAKPEFEKNKDADRKPMTDASTIGNKTYPKQLEPSAPPAPPVAAAPKPGASAAAGKALALAPDAVTDADSGIAKEAEPEDVVVFRTAHPQALQEELERLARSSGAELAWVQPQDGKTQSKNRTSPADEANGHEGDGMPELVKKRRATPEIFTEYTLKVATADQARLLKQLREIKPERLGERGEALARRDSKEARKKSETSSEAYTTRLSAPAEPQLAFAASKAEPKPNAAAEPPGKLDAARETAIIRIRIETLSVARRQDSDGENP